MTFFLLLELSEASCNKSSKDRQTCILTSTDDASPANNFGSLRHPRRLNLDGYSINKENKEDLKTLEMNVAISSSGTDYEGKCFYSKLRNSSKLAFVDPYDSRVFFSIQEGCRAELNEVNVKTAFSQFGPVRVVIIFKRPVVGLDGYVGN